MIELPLQYKVFNKILSKIIMMVSWDIILNSEKIDKVTKPFWHLLVSCFFCVLLINKKKHL